MENNKINIAEILKDCPKGTKLYSSIFGNVSFERVLDGVEYPIYVVDKNSGSKYFSKDGQYISGYPDAECQLFPSSEMRDWSRFFKHGDVVIDYYYGCGVLVEEWADESYTSFKASVFQLKKGGFAKRDKSIISIDGFDKASDEQRDKFIADIEKFFGGKYNPETLQVETVRVECPFKPFDKVLVRDNNEQEWKINFFSHYEEDVCYKYNCLKSCYNQCIPYEGNEHLLGTNQTYNGNK